MLFWITCAMAGDVKRGRYPRLAGGPACSPGSVSRGEKRSLNGIPGMGAGPGVNQLMTTNSKQVDEDELLVVITPYVVSAPPAESAVVWLRK